LSPELSEIEDMLALVDQSIQKKQPIIHMYLHSSSLIDGATGLLDGPNAFETICQRIEVVTQHLAKNANVKFCTISEAKVHLSNRSASSGVIKGEQN